MVLYLKGLDVVIVDYDNTIYPDRKNHANIPSSFKSPDVNWSFTNKNHSSKTSSLSILFSVVENRLLFAMLAKRPLMGFYIIRFQSSMLSSFWTKESLVLCSFFGLELNGLDRLPIFCGTFLVFVSLLRTANGL